MTISAEQRQLVQTTWLKVVPIADAAAGMFYQRLFELDPRLEGLFRPADLPAQRSRLVQMLSAAVSGLDSVETLEPVLKDLGRRHVQYRVRDEHYATVGEALLWTLEKGLGPDYTREVAEAWTATYGLIADVMRRGAREASAA
jgi:hemoglobin-like flavoprotein